MAKDKAVVAAFAGAVALAESAAVDNTVRLYLLRPWCTGNGVEYPAHVEGEPALEFDFTHLPDGISAGDFDFLIANGLAESAAMRDARLKAARKP